MSTDLWNIHLVQPTLCLKQGFGKQIKFRNFTLIFWKETYQVQKITSGVENQIYNGRGGVGAGGKPSILVSFF